MFDLDKWQEILHTIDKNRLRSMITAFNVAWGIFILIILMGFGKGFQNGIENQFRDDAVNTIFFWPGRTSIAYKGMQPGRTIDFTNEDYERIQQQVKGIDHISGRLSIRGEFTVRYEDKYSSFYLRSVHPDYQYIEQSELISGRYINEKDIREKRKVAAIGTNVLKILFGQEDPLGKYLTIADIKYKVVGVFKDEGSEWEAKVIYIPLSTAQVAYGGGNQVDNIRLTTGEATLEESKRIQDEIHTLLAESHKFSKEDERAMESYNVYEEYSQWMGVFIGIRIFLAFIGSFTLVAGIVGVSNIMLIVVKERTREIGVRKAIGASPASVIGLFLMEALLITVLSGYVGMVLGMIFIETGTLSTLMSSFGFPTDFFMNPHVDFFSASVATFILAISGTLAGFFPARKAAKIPPVVALRDE